jgi:hypothetical protein
MLPFANPARFHCFSDLLECDLPHLDKAPHALHAV